MQALVESERQRAAQALKSSEVRRQKLEETQTTVLQLQDVVNRMMYSMSGQFSELKSMLRPSSSSSVTSGCVIKDSYRDTTFTSSDLTSNDSYDSS
ncbi:hypothetical protein Hanom_Chr01g00013411 [Helianthus anomalus]